MVKLLALTPENAAPSNLPQQEQIPPHDSDWSGIREIRTGC